jgi:hypothetical protein
VLESVERLYPGQLTFKLAAWRFDVLRESAVFEIALHDASRAVIVLLSAHGRGGLPEAVDLWLQQWLDWKKDEPCALAISLDESWRVSDASFQIVSSLQERARAKNVAIFHHFILPRRIESRSTTQTVQRRPHASMATLDHNQHWTEPHLGWGINE